MNKIVLNAIVQCNQMHRFQIKSISQRKSIQTNQFTQSAAFFAVFRDVFISTFCYAMFLLR